MNRLPERLITKTGKAEAYYEYVICRYIAPHFTFFLKRLKISNPNIVTFCSFFILLIAGLLTSLVRLHSNLLYRAVIALLIQLSFILDCSDGQLARILGRTSKLGAWLDKILDRVGEFIIFSIFGYAAWLQTGNELFLYLGVFTGYCLSAYTLAMAYSGMCQLNNIVKVSQVKRKRSQQKAAGPTKQSFKNTPFALTVSKIFFFLTFGIGERYLYLSFFILLGRIDIMLYISSFLTFIRMISISYYVSNSLRKTDKMIREIDE